MKNPSFAATLRNSKGFTLIEMAIVLVIIGIILAAVMKGQDLVEGAKSKQFATKIQSWQVALNTYYDRKGRFPGDENKDGVISSTGDNLSPLDDITSAKFESPPEGNFKIGASTFYVSLGNSGSAANYLVITKSTSAAYLTTDSADTAALKYFEAFDNSIDGTADPTNGNVKGFTSVTTDTATAKLTALSGAPTTADWLANDTIKALGLRLK